MSTDLGCRATPDAPTLLNFRRLSEECGLTGQIFDILNGHLASKRMLIRHFAIVDSTVIAMPSSTKGELLDRNPEVVRSMRPNDQERQPVAFRHKVVNGCGSTTGIMLVVVTAVNISAVIQAPRLLHDKEMDALGDKRKAEKMKPSIRALIEHSFDVVKNRFGHRKLRYSEVHRNMAHKTKKALTFQ